VCFAVGGLLYAPYPALSATLFQRESPPELLSQVLAARGALTVLASPLGTALGGPLTAWLGAQHTLLASAVATIACGLAATVFLIARRRAEGRPAAGRAGRSQRSGSEELVADPLSG
jgi:predicted MFS family arabinose efflux permease